MWCDEAETINDSLQMRTPEIASFDPIAIPSTLQVPRLVGFHLFSGSEGWVSAGKAVNAIS